MNIPDYKNRGLRATDTYTAVGIYFGGRGLLTVFLTLITPALKGSNPSISIMFGLTYLALGVILFKLGTHFAPKGIYRTGSNQDWGNCITRILENAKRADSNVESSPTTKPKVSQSQDIDIQYHW